MVPDTLGRIRTGGPGWAGVDRHDTSLPRPKGRPVAGPPAAGGAAARALAGGVVAAVEAACILVVSLGTGRVPLLAAAVATVRAGEAAAAAGGGGGGGLIDQGRMERPGSLCGDGGEASKYAFPMGTSANTRPMWIREWIRRPEP